MCHCQAPNLHYEEDLGRSTQYWPIAGWVLQTSFKEYNLLRRAGYLTMFSSLLARSFATKYSFMYEYMKKLRK